MTLKITILISDKINSVMSLKWIKLYINKIKSSQQLRKDNVYKFIVSQYISITLR